MKLKQLESYLQDVSVFSHPKIMLEQYPTSPHIASRMLYTAESTYGDIDGAMIADLGVGCGILSIGAQMMGASYGLGIDIDPQALAQTRENMNSFDMHMDLMRINVQELVDPETAQISPLAHRLQADTVVMNPPFGTKVKGADMMFLELASQMAQVSIYSLHKTSTRDHIIKRADSLGLNTHIVAELRYDIPHMYKFHKKKSIDIEVDFLRFSFKNQH